MPSFEDIEKFGDELRNIAGEARELEERGEEAPRIARPTIDYDEFLSAQDQDPSQGGSVEGKDAQSLAQQFFDNAEAEERGAGLTLGDDQLSDFEEIYAQAATEGAEPTTEAPKPEAEEGTDDIAALLGAVEAETPPTDDITQADEGTTTEEGTDDIAALLGAVEAETPPTDDITQADEGTTTEEGTDDIAALLGAVEAETPPTDDIAQADEAFTTTEESTDDIAALLGAVEAETPPTDDITQADEGTTTEEGTDDIAALLGAVEAETPPTDDITQADEGTTTEESTDDIAALLGAVEAETPPTDDITQADEGTTTEEGTDDITALLGAVEAEAPPTDDITQADEAFTTEEGTDDIAALLGDSEAAPDQAPSPKEEVEPDIEQLSSMIEEIQLETEDIAHTGTSGEAQAGHREPEPDEEPQEADEEKEFSEKEFQKILSSIEALPLELRKVVSAYLTDEKQPEQDVKRLISLLLGTVSPHTIARFIYRKTGIRVEVPQGYVKETLEELEARSQHGFEKFKASHAPLIITVALWLFGILLGGYLMLTFVYRPLAARIQYRRGYAAVQNEEYSQGNEQFVRAWELWRSESWLFRFVDVFLEKNEYALAVEKYDQLVYGINPSLRDILIQKTREGLLSDLFEIQGEQVRLMDLITLHEEGILAHASLQTRVLGNYDRALELVSVLLEADKFDQEALLAQGDIFVRRGDREDSRYYRDAGASYALALTEHGRKDAIMSRIGWHATRTQNYEQMTEVLQHFTQDRSFDVIPEMHADMVGYLIDTYTIEDIPHLVSQIHDSDPYFPETYYHFARYSRIVEIPSEEYAALQDAASLFAEHEPLQFERLYKLVDTHIRLGEYYYTHNRFLDAEQSFQHAVRHYTEGIRSQTLSPSTELGRVYEALGDIRYYHSNLPDEALEYFEKAILERLSSEDLFYKTGYLLYYRERYPDASLFFLDAGTPTQKNVEVQLAMGNTLYQMENYASATAFFQTALGLLEEQRSAIPSLFVDDNEKHRRLIETMISTHNNLGASLYRIWERSSEQEKYSEALYHFEQSIELSENIRRDSISRRRSDAKSLAYINFREALYPRNNFSVQIYQSIPLDREAFSFTAP